MTKFNVTSQLHRLTDVILGKSYAPEFYSYIKNVEVREKIERIARETEEDYQNLMQLFDMLRVKYYRPELSADWTKYKWGDLIVHPPMTPSDYMIMIGDKFLYSHMPPFSPLLPRKALNLGNVWQSCFLTIAARENSLIPHSPLSSANTLVLGDRIIHGYYEGDIKPGDIEQMDSFLTAQFPGVAHSIRTGVCDANFCLVSPTLILTYNDDDYSDDFPNAEVVRIPYNGWHKFEEFIDAKGKNRDAWFNISADLSGQFNDYLDLWLNKYMHVNFFDVNMIVVDEKTVIVNNYNEHVFDAFARHGVTPYIARWRHRYFWNGGLHCITAELNRENNGTV